MIRTKAFLRDVCKHYRSGKTIYEVAEIMGCSSYTALSILHDEKVSIRPRRNNTQKIVMKHLSDIKQLVAEGHHTTDIALSVGITPNNLARELNRLGIRRIGSSPNGSKYAKHHQRIVQMRRDGYSLSEIASEFGYSTSAGLSGYISRKCIPLGVGVSEENWTL
jgi:DNA-binding CsgD family transcriptional regulator